MPLPVPNLDDRRFQDFVDAAKREIPHHCPQWTDHNVSDPGITLIELFAWMTEQYIFRLNQVPEKNYVAFLNLMGARLEPGQPAKGDVTFTLARAPEYGERAVIPAGTEVATERAKDREAIGFTTDREAVVVPPTPIHLLAGGDGVPCEEHDAALQGSAPFDVWGDQPLSDRSLYIGFSEDLSGHTVGLRLTLEQRDLGLDRTNDPPWRWEAWLGPDDGWYPVEVGSDKTAGLTEEGEIQIYLPYDCRPDSIQGNDAATWIRCSPRGDKDLAPGQRPYVKSPCLINLSAYAVGITVPVTHGSVLGPEDLGVSTGLPGQIFVVQQKHILPLEGDEEVIEVKTEDGWEQWTIVEDFGDSHYEDHHVTFDPVTGEVAFGPMVPQPEGKQRNFGAVPPRGAAVRIRRFRVGGGRHGNVKEGQATTLKSSVPGVAGVVNRARMNGGTNTQRLEDAKVTAPARLRYRNRAVTAEDFEYLAQQVQGVGRAHCVSPDDLDDDDDSDRRARVPPGTVQLLVIPDLDDLEEDQMREEIQARSLLPDQDQREAAERRLTSELELPQETRVRLTDFLRTRKLVTTRVDIREPNYVWVAVEATVKRQRKFDPEKVRSDVQAALYRFLHPLYGGIDGRGWPFGGLLSIDKVYWRIQQVSGVEYVTSVGLKLVNLKGALEGRFRDPRQLIEVPPDGVIASYYHQILLAE